MGSRKAKRRAHDKSRLSRRLKQRQENQEAQRRKGRPELGLVNLKPQPVANEPIEDVAIFAKASREQLPDDLKLEAAAVAESLDLVYQGDFEAAMGRLGIISRRSRLSDWRLFIRGLVAFYNSDPDAARENWARLDRARRPARIATTLLCAETAAPLDREMSPPSSKILEPLKAVFLQRGAVTAARRIAAVKHRDANTVFSASQVAMLTALRDEYQTFDGDFATKFAQACMRLAYFETNSRVFELLKAAVPGPPHDPHWNLLGVTYCLSFADAQEPMKRFADSYLNSDLPKLTHLPQKLKDALASVLYVRHANMLTENGSGMGGLFGGMFTAPDFKQADELLRKAIKKYPANRQAYQDLLATLRMRIDDYRATDRQEKQFQEQIVAVKEQLVAVFPDEIETTLELIDHYFDTDQLQKADSLVGQLSGQRLDDPRAKAIPWKLKLCEAMRQSRKKASLPAARAALDAAESLWPGWLRRDYLPFLRAAIELRAGDQAVFEQLNAAARQACGANAFIGDVMTFASLQQMNLPGRDIKPLRETIDSYARSAKSMALGDLCSLGSFFWDLSRTGLRHSGYRLQASKFGKVLCARLERGEQADVHASFLDACCWAGEHRFWRAMVTVESLRWLVDISLKEPKVAATLLKCFFNQRDWGYRFTQLRSQIALLQEAARMDTDPFYRHYFDVIAKQASAAVAEYDGRRATRGGFAPFGQDWYEDDDSDEDDYEDAPCDCPKCRARRARATSAKTPAPSRYEQARANSIPTLFDLEESNEEDDAEEDDDYEAYDDDDYDDDDLPPILVKVFMALGPDGVDEMKEIMENTRDSADFSQLPFAPLEPLVVLFRKVGLSPSDAMEFLEACAEGGARLAAGEQQPQREPASVAARMSAQERRDMDKQRRRQLDKKRRKRR